MLFAGCRTIKNMLSCSEASCGILQSWITLVSIPSSLLPVPSIVSTFLWKYCCTAQHNCCLCCSQSVWFPQAVCSLASNQGRAVRDVNPGGGLSPGHYCILSVTCLGDCLSASEFNAPLPTPCLCLERQRWNVGPSLYKQLHFKMQCNGRYSLLIGTLKRRERWVMKG